MSSMPWAGWTVTPGTSWPTALTVANDTAYLLGRNVSHTIS